MTSSAKLVVTYLKRLAAVIAEKGRCKLQIIPFKFQIVREQDIENAKRDE